MERFADEIDLAQMRIEQLTELALASLRGGFGHANGRTTCLDCGERIPERRLTHVPHAVRCVACQELHERKATSR